MDLRATTKLVAMFIPLLAFATPAFGAEVSGTVTIRGQPFVGRLTLPNGIQVDIANGQYSLLLPADVYSVVLVDRSGQVYKATIQSSTVPVIWDIKLQP